jgi:hypothetical protein
MMCRKLLLLKSPIFSKIIFNSAIRKNIKANSLIIWFSNRFCDPADTAEREQKC